MNMIHALISTNNVSIDYERFGWVLMLAAFVAFNLAIVMSV